MTALLGLALWAVGIRHHASKELLVKSHPMLINALSVERGDWIQRGWMGCARPALTWLMTEVFYRGITKACVYLRQLPIGAYRRRRMCKAP